MALYAHALCPILCTRSQLARGLPATIPRQCPRPHLQRCFRTFSTFQTRRNQRVRDEGPLFRDQTKEGEQPSSPKQAEELLPPKGQDTESVKPESFEAPKPADASADSVKSVQQDGKAKAQGQPNDPLLQETTVSNKEQRKADWAIIKEMSKYLWPKDSLGTRFRVGASVVLLVGAKVCLYSLCAIPRTHRVDGQRWKLEYDYQLI